MRLFKLSISNIPLFLMVFLVVLPTFLFAQDELPQQNLEWQQIIYDSVRAWEYTPVLETFRRLSGASDAEEFYIQAENYYRDVIANEPEQESAFCAYKNLFLLQIISGHYADSDKTLENMKSLYSDHPLLAKCIQEAGDLYYFHTDQTAKAVDLYQQALQKATTEEAMMIQRGLALAHIRKGELEPADAITDQLLTEYSEHPKIALALREIANAYYYADDFYKARTLYQWIDQHDPGDESIWVKHGLVITNLRLADYATAESLLEKLLSDYFKHSGIPVVLKETADTYFYYANDPLKARSLYKQILRDWPDSYEAMAAQRGLALTSIDLREPEAADTAVEKLSSDYSNHPQIAFALRELADRYFYYANEPSKACVLYERILQNWPDSPEAIDAQRGLAMAKVKMDDTEAANTAADKLLSDFEGQVDLAEKTAQILHEYCRAGRTVEAIALSEKILNSNPKPEMALVAHTGMAQAYVQLGQDERVQEKVSLLLSSFKGEKQIGYSLFVVGEGYYFLGERDLQEGNKQQAKENYLKAIGIWEKNRLIPEDPKHQAHAMYYIAKAYHTLDQYEKAMGCYRQVIEKWPTYENIQGAKKGVFLCYYKTGEDREATLSYNQVFLHNPSISAEYKGDRGFLAADHYCGAYVVWHLIRYYGGTISIEDAIKSLKINDRGYCTVGDIVNFLNSYGIDANVMQIDSEKIALIETPFIQYKNPKIEMDTGHFVLCIPNTNSIFVLDGIKEPQAFSKQLFINNEFKEGEIIILIRNRVEYNDSNNQARLSSMSEVAHKWINNRDYALLIQKLTMNKGGCDTEKCIDIGAECFTYAPCETSLECLVTIPLCDDDTQEELCYGTSIFNCYYDVAHICEPSREKVQLCTANGVCLVNPLSNLGPCGTWIFDCYQSWWY